ncbi:hypothetical protein BABINDRAFT_162483 [Babjeviella inositovora NRRL Y-12698]|uniref:DNA mismatch repair protein n=1 Tax=Babjeviella inositovora NRRL Y-12698 TaxID=984486 RepID=A0A1E3QNZ2_9ASCO|nr:uncharacterized protein BABINDRAFT_162483 [Babjeviella inositovora NRRL Y-12698]ODQ78802.1 hypothetical protein BABINDRAFT_162483 [Babjeviella inositovora NRRL Y-12698]
MTQATPKKPTKKPTGSGAKLKQQSLLSFFAPSSSPNNSPTADPKNKSQDIPSSPLKAREDKADGKVSSTGINGAPATDSTGAVGAPDEIEMNDVTMLDCPPDADSTDIPSSPAPPVAEFARLSRLNISYVESDSDDDVSLSNVKKRRVTTFSDDEDEFKPTEEPVSEDEVEMADLTKELEGSDAESEDEILSKKKPKSSNLLESKFSAKSSYTAKVAPRTKALPKAAKKSFTKENEERYSWLVDVRDAEKRPVSDPDYDSRTLFVPSSAWAKFTAFEKQYWEIKSVMWDTVVFFKKGKFYELYENDAHIASTRFDLKIAGGGRANMKLAGVPEMSFDYWAKQFIDAGYKVAKVDQKESMLAKEMREKSTLLKEDKVIKRELKCVLTGGTLTELGMITDDMAIYCLAIREETDGTEKVFGLAWVDTTTLEVRMLEFRDDQECSRLDTLITQLRPKEIVVEKGNLCTAATRILKFNLASQPIWNHLTPRKEFWDYETTYENLVRGGYYPAKDLDDLTSFPPLLVSCHQESRLAFAAFGGLLSYLSSLQLDREIMTLGNFKPYDASGAANSTLILDGITLNNLEVFNNSFDGGDKGTLFKLVNRGITGFGKRMLKQWVMAPLLRIDDINGRLDTVEFLLSNDGNEFRSHLEQGLTGLPDLERLLARIHSRSLRFRDFVKVVESFERIVRFFIELAAIKDYDAVPGVLGKLLEKIPEGLPPAVESWTDAFDRVEALQDVIIPQRGVDLEFDASLDTMKGLEDELNVVLKEYRRVYKSQEICYRDSGKEIYTVEVPVKCVKLIPKDWQQMAATSKVKRYWSPEVKELARRLTEQRELHKDISNGMKSRLYERFTENYSVFQETLKLVAQLDCLIALARTSESLGFPACRPELVDSSKGELSFVELRHPCFLTPGGALSSSVKEFIPNDVVLGGDHSGIGLLTGANAAGKSTLLRMTCIAVVLAQVGCYVPCESARMTPVDRIMTRLGANDNLLQGKSTFYVELAETKKILETATPKSLVILDELGRGGSSSDGYAIAEAVLYHLATHIQAMGFFATHYGNLGLAFASHPQVTPLRMKILVERESRNITFLYKLEPGAAEGSFGMNVAAMCGIEESIITKAEQAAEEHEHTSKMKRSRELSQQNVVPLGLQSDFSWFLRGLLALQGEVAVYPEEVRLRAVKNVLDMIERI